jgi:hypothetical protein
MSSNRKFMGISARDIAARKNLRALNLFRLVLKSFLPNTHFSLKNSLLQKFGSAELRLDRFTAYKSGRRLPTPLNAPQTQRLDSLHPSSIPLNVKIHTWLSGLVDASQALSGDEKSSLPGFRTTCLD